MANLISPLEYLVDILNLTRPKLNYWFHTLPLTEQTACFCSGFLSPTPPKEWRPRSSNFSLPNVGATIWFIQQTIIEWHVYSRLCCKWWRSVSWTNTCISHTPSPNRIYILVNLISVSLSPHQCLSKFGWLCFHHISKSGHFLDLHPFPPCPSHHSLSPGLLH